MKKKVNVWIFVIVGVVVLLAIGALFYGIRSATGYAAGVNALCNYNSIEQGMYEGKTGSQICATIQRGSVCQYTFYQTRQSFTDPSNQRTQVVDTYNSIRKCGETSSVSSKLLNVSTDNFVEPYLGQNLAITTREGVFCCK